MKKITSALCLFLLISSMNGIAQEFKLGKVTIEELQQKQHPKDTSAVAAILFEKGSVYFEGLVTITTIKTKIKIYNKHSKNGVCSCYVKSDYALLHFVYLCLFGFARSALQGTCLLTKIISFGPLAKLSPLFGVNTVSNRNHNIKVIKGNGSV